MPTAPSTGLLAAEWHVALSATVATPIVGRQPMCG